MKLTYPGVQSSTSCVRTEIRLGWALLVVTAAVTGLLGWELTDTAARFLKNEDWAAATGHLVFMGIVAALLYGSVVYQLTRIGSFQRRATFAPATDPELSRTYHEAAGKLVVLVPSYKEEAGFASGDSGDLLFRELVLRKAAQAHLAAAASLELAAGQGGLNRPRLQLEYHRLARRFRVRLGSFERKRYANLSHEPNKAMNLNSYLGLMGACYREVHRTDGVHLQRAEDAHRPCDVPLCSRRPSGPGSCSGSSLCSAHGSGSARCCVRTCRGVGA